VANAIAEPARARMLALLLSGEARSAGELAKAVNVTPQTASSHLALLRDAGLVSLRTQGRHRYFTLADAEVAHLLETLSLVAERDEVNRRWEQADWKPLKHARTCYCHLAGELGVRLYDALLRAAVLVPHRPDRLTLGAGASHWLREARFSDDEANRLARASGKARFAYGCMDWSERREHLAGPLARDLLEHFMAQGWLQRVGQTRALVETPSGARDLLPLLSR